MTKERNLIKVCGQCRYFTPLCIKQGYYDDSTDVFESKFGVCAHDLQDNEDESECNTCRHISEQCAHSDKYLEE